MMNPNNKTQAAHSDPWTERVNQLCYNIYFNTADGKELLQLWQQRYFFSPVALLGKDPSYAFFGEGRNDFIRSISHAAHSFMQNPENKKIAPNVDRERK